MGVLDMTETEFGAVGIKGIVGGFKGACALLQIDLPNRRRFYVEYRQNFADNHRDFGIDIIKCGLVDPLDAGIPGARCERLSVRDILAVKKLIEILFSGKESQKSRDNTPEFSIKNSNFVGPINYLSGWALDSNGDKL